jgi:protein SCO1/2
MTVLQKAFKKDPKKETAFDTTVHFVSVTVQPEADSFPALRAYAENYDADHDRWWFLTGDRNAIYDYAHNELGLVMGETTGGAEDMTHSQKIVLVDKDRNIRGYYDGLDPDDLKRCADDIIILSLEKKRKKK